MDYFKKLPVIDYAGDLSTNILARAKIRDMILNNTVTFHPFFVSDGDRPDIVSDKYYGSYKHTWLLFYANEIFCPLYDWPLSVLDFREFIEDKYGTLEDSLTTIHHYEQTGIADVGITFDEAVIIDRATFEALPASDVREVSQYTYEERINDEKRNIKIIDSRFLRQILSEFRRLF